MNYVDGKLVDLTLHDPDLATIDRLYRVEYSNYECGSVNLCMTYYDIVARTPKGVWIEFYGKKRKFVLLYGRKRYAYPTQIEALVAFHARKASHIKHLIRELDLAKRLGELARLHINGVGEFGELYPFRAEPRYGSTLFELARGLTP